ncbi:hypothetical protein ACMDCR_29110 [Labrys okinawensis]|uniref:hypothetical protein n=1 Tax=Labrys okinawensis TaxID=346911 RepID=UPI0039BC5932
MHGTDDDAIPIRFARKLFDLASQPKLFIAIEGGGHLPMQEAMPQLLAWIRES